MTDLKFAAQYVKLMRDLGAILCILQCTADDFLRCNADEMEIEKLIAERNSARQNKNWQLADEIRKNLERQGIVLEDTAQGTVWRRINHGI